VTKFIAAITTTKKEMESRNVAGEHTRLVSMRLGCGQPVMQGTTRPARALQACQWGHWKSLAPGSGRTSHLGLLKRVCPCILRIRSIVALFDGLIVRARA
jgi:hypothetical protein